MTTISLSYACSVLVRVELGLQHALTQCVIRPILMLLEAGLRRNK
jgi:hypothetical protein